MTIIQRNSDGTIKTIMEIDAGTVLENGEILEETSESFEELMSKLVLSSGGISGETIRVPVSDDPVIVDISCPGKKTVDLLVNEVVTTIKLTGGLGTLAIPGAPERVVSIKPADLKIYCPGGNASMTIVIGEQKTLEDRVRELETLLDKLLAE